MPLTKEQIYQQRHEKIEIFKCKKPFDASQSGQFTNMKSFEGNAEGMEQSDFYLKESNLPPSRRWSAEYNQEVCNVWNQICDARSLIETWDVNGMIK